MARGTFAAWNDKGYPKRAILLSPDFPSINYWQIK
jgi:hypothetical protein